jgi:hypothetical protein
MIPPGDQRKLKEQVRRHVGLDEANEAMGAENSINTR